MFISATLKLVGILPIIFSHTLTINNVTINFKKINSHPGSMFRIRSRSNL